jgi:CRP-like cAMP-binding protein
MRARYKDGRMVDEAAVLSSLSPALKSEVMACCAKELATKVPWLRNHPKLHTQIATIAVPRFALDGDMLLQQGDLAHTVYIISQGVVELSKTFSNGWGTETEPLLMRAVGDGCTFGVVSVVLDVRIAATATAKGNVMLYAIGVDDFKRMLLEDEQSAKYFNYLARFRKRKYDKSDRRASINNDDGTSSDEESDDEDPDDSRTELFKLSMQLANMEHGNQFLGSLREKNKETQHINQNY